MKKNAMRKNLTQSILKSLCRYLAIIMIIALGSGMFVGLLMTKFDMVATGQKYMEEQNMFDLRLISSYGWDLEHVDAVAQLDGVQEAEGVQYLDAVASLGNIQENAVFRFYGIPQKLNRVALRGGRMPQAPDECLADGYMYGEDIIGMQVQISDANEDSTLDSFATKQFTVVGIVASPLYMDMNRGNTSIGSGSLSSFFYIPPEALDMDYYVEINVTIPGDYDIYTDDYNNAMEAAAEKLEPLATPLITDRYETIYNDAMKEYRKGRQEYEDGVKTFKEEKVKALQELEDAHQRLIEAENTIAKNEKLLRDSEAQIASGWEELEAGRKELDAGWESYHELVDPLEGASDETIKALQDEIAKHDAALAEIDAELVQIEEKLGTVDGSNQAEIVSLDWQIANLNGRINAASYAIQAAKDSLNILQQSPLTPQVLIDSAQKTIDSLESQKADYDAQLAELIRQRQELTNSGSGDQITDEERETLQDRREQLLVERAYHAALMEIAQLTLDGAEGATEGFMNLLASTRAELEAAEAQYEAGRQQLLDGEQALKNGKKQLKDGRKEIENGWEEYKDGQIKAEEEFAKAEEELEEAKLLLDDAWDKIMDMDEASIYVMDRNSNIGYGSLDSASDIVAGVSRVLPAFFLLVASLVCITTMTRMIDEERTQIGTLKALGYSNGAIISKYLVYAGSGAVIGCGLGVIVGSMAFPAILWEAYKIMLYITDGVVLRFNWLLCALVIAVYTLVMLSVTWYCCRRTLKEEPAELIRPKAPEAGKKIFLEYLPFWHRISFLNKVTIRNIIRYRQRLAMMLVGIGGCTALLLTGFGLRDSIVNVVDFQFENVTVYDMTVYFSEGQTETQQSRFSRLTEDCVDNVLFFNQISAELEFDNQLKEIYLMTADDEIEEFLNFKKGEERIPMPGINEVLLTVGVTENMGIKVGDEIVMRNADMEELKLTVSGIYDNHVNNYAVIIPETVQAQWNRIPEEQMALIQVRDDVDVYDASTTITDLSGVLNVSISQDLADLVGSMMDALDLVVWVIVFCAGLLAVIVLYNLTNININERIREIATIKVLGFNASETSAYVFKENISMTVIGAIFGLGLGYLLLVFVMTQIKIDMVWFKAMIMERSYVFSILLTMLSALLVNFVFYFKLDKINMAEALKSVE